MPEDVHTLVQEVLGGGGDADVLEYIIGVLSDEHYEHGDDGEGTYEHLGPLLLEAGCCRDEASAREACRQLAARLGPAAAAAALPAAALARGPVVLADADDRALLHGAEQLRSGKDLIQTPYGALPTISDKVRGVLCSGTDQQSVIGGRGRHRWQERQLPCVGLQGCGRRAYTSVCFHSFIRSFILTFECAREGVCVNKGCAAGLSAQPAHMLHVSA